MGILSKLFGKSGKDNPKSNYTGTNRGGEPGTNPSTTSQPTSNQAATSQADSNQATSNQTTTKNENNQQEQGGATSAQTLFGEQPAAVGKSHIYNLIIVDESGSMGHLRQVTLSGVNETINTIKSAQKQFADTQTHTLTLVTFDSGDPRGDVRTIIDNKPVEEVGEFTDYSPNGCTPLYDAMGMSLTRLHNLIKNDKDATGVVTVLTDGLENASREWRPGPLGQLISQLKEEGWTFSYMGSAHDVKSVTDLLHIDNVVEFDHDNLGAESTWARESTSRFSLYRKMNKFKRERPQASQAEMVNAQIRYSKDFYSGRVTPDFVNHLEPGEIFVFGSNAQGMHGGGAARQAALQFGAIMGQGEGLQGQSYAIPTMEGLDSLKAAVERFIVFADEHPEMNFLVTRIGCGIAGYRDSQIAPLFKRCIKMENVALPGEFWKELGLNMF
mgnify:FL=1